MKKKSDNLNELKAKVVTFKEQATKSNQHQEDKQRIKCFLSESNEQVSEHPIYIKLQVKTSTSNMSDEDAGKRIKFIYGSERRPSDNDSTTTSNLTKKSHNRTLSHNNRVKFNDIIEFYDPAIQNRGNYSLKEFALLKQNPNLVIKRSPGNSLTSWTDLAARSKDENAEKPDKLPRIEFCFSEDVITSPVSDRIEPRSSISSEAIRNIQNSLMQAAKQTERPTDKTNDLNVMYDRVNQINQSRFEQDVSTNRSKADESSVVNIPIETCDTEACETTGSTSAIEDTRSISYTISNSPTRPFVPRGVVKIKSNNKPVVLRRSAVTVSSPTTPATTPRTWEESRLDANRRYSQGSLDNKKTSIFTTCVEPSYTLEPHVFDLKSSRVFDATRPSNRGFGDVKMQRRSSRSGEVQNEKELNSIFKRIYNRHRFSLVNDDQSPGIRHFANTQNLTNF